ncbi:MAG: polysaccharide deacetylase family protein [Alphaproteobacteria bacterium]
MDGGDDRGQGTEPVAVQEDNTIISLTRSGRNGPRIRCWQRWLAAGLLAVGFTAGFAAAAPAADGAVILMYHRFGETKYPTTNIQLEQFEAHLRILSSEGYTVLPVAEIVAAIRNGTPLPDKTIGITIDDAYLSVFIQAWPMLRDAGMPFTLFVSTDAVDQGLGGFMSWAQIRELRDAGVTIGGHSASHGHMAAKNEGGITEELTRSADSFEAQLGTTPGIFAYPYGEASEAVIQAVRDAGYDTAFGQHSGVLHKTTNSYYLPRFALNETFGDEDRFRMVTRALPLPVQDVTPSDPTLRTNPPAFGFTLTEDLAGLDRLACYASGQGETVLERLGPRVEVRVTQGFPKGRARINCTAPGPDGRWHWFGMQFYVPGDVAKAAN